jgi:hypothetical protein
MIKLAELIQGHVIKDRDRHGGLAPVENTGLTPVDNWKITDAMYLEDMGFKTDGMYYYALKNPEMKVSHKKGEGFILEDKAKKGQFAFRKFKELEEYFAKYKQKWKNQPYL